MLIGHSPEKPGVAIIETFMPFTFPLNVPLLAVVPHVQDSEGPDCAIVKRMMVKGNASFPVHHVPATEAVPPVGAVGLEQPTTASSDATMSATRRGIKMSASRFPKRPLTHPALCVSASSSFLHGMKTRHLQNLANATDSGSNANASRPVERGHVACRRGGSQNQTARAREGISALACAVRERSAHLGERPTGRRCDRRLLVAGIEEAADFRSR
jgi:hypothetical protein